MALDKEKSEEMCRELQKLFGSVFTYVGGDTQGAFSSEGAVEFTFQQMMELPTILGTEHLNFHTEVESDPWYSDMTPGGGSAVLTITATWN